MSSLGLPSPCWAADTRPAAMVTGSARCTAPTASTADAIAPVDVAIAGKGRGESAGAVCDNIQRAWKEAHAQTMTKCVVPPN